MKMCPCTIQEKILTRKGQGQNTEDDNRVIVYKKRVLQTGALNCAAIFHCHELIHAMLVQSSGMHVFSRKLKDLRFEKKSQQQRQKSPAHFQNERQSVIVTTGESNAINEANTKSGY